METDSGSSINSGDRSIKTEIEDDIWAMKGTFDEKMKSYNSSKGDNVIKKPWTKPMVAEAIKDILDSRSPGNKKSNRHYNLIRKYDIMEMDGKSFLIKKKKADSNPVVVILPIEDYFDILLHIHHSTGHGGREKMLNALKSKYYIPRPAVEVFISLCKMCNAKRAQHHRNTDVARPIVSKDFTFRGQVDLMDFQSTPYNDYKWLMSYRDHATKFLHLRPLRSQSAAEAALELLKIFLEFGAPHILQSNNGREFTASVIRKLEDMWPDCKIIHGRPCHLQTQGSVECSNQDILNMLKAWMDENASTDWPTGCFFVQWQKNCSRHQVTDCSPYKALFGMEPKVGLGSTNIPTEILENMESEEDLKQFLEKNTLAEETTGNIKVEENSDEETYCNHSKLLENDSGSDKVPKCEISAQSTCAPLVPATEMDGTLPCKREIKSDEEEWAA